MRTTQEYFNTHNRSYSHLRNHSATKTKYVFHDPVGEGILEYREGADIHDTLKNFQFMFSFFATSINVQNSESKGDNPIIAII